MALIAEDDGIVPDRTRCRSACNDLAVHSAARDRDNVPLGAAACALAAVDIRHLAARHANDVAPNSPCADRMSAIEIGRCPALDTDRIVERRTRADRISAIDMHSRSARNTNRIVMNRTGPHAVSAVGVRRSPRLENDGVVDCRARVTLAAVNGLCRVQSDALDRDGVVGGVSRRRITADNIPVDRWSCRTGLTDRNIVAVLIPRCLSSVDPRCVSRIRRCNCYITGIRGRGIQEKPAPCGQSERHIQSQLAAFLQSSHPVSSSVFQLPPQPKQPPYTYNRLLLTYYK